MTASRPWSVEIRVRGPVAVARAYRLGLRASVEPPGTVLRGALADRSALLGALERMRTLGLELVDVRRLPETPATSRYAADRGQSSGPGEAPPPAPDR